MYGPLMCDQDVPEPSEVVGDSGVYEKEVVGRQGLEGPGMRSGSCGLKFWSVGSVGYDAVGRDNVVAMWFDTGTKPCLGS